MNQTIDKYLDEILNLQKEIGHSMPEFLNPPASINEIEAVEKKLDLKFNGELRELFLKINGVKQNPGSELMTVYNLCNLNAAIELYDPHSINCHIETFNESKSNINKSNLNLENGQNKYFPFLEDDCGDIYWVDLNQDTNNYGKIFWVNTLAEPPDYLFNSLLDFFKMIFLSYKKKIFFRDKRGELDCDYQQWKKLCHEIDDSVEYWKPMIKKDFLN